MWICPWQQQQQHQQHKQQQASRREAGPTWAWQGGVWQQQGQVALQGRSVRSWTVTHLAGADSSCGLAGSQQKLGVRHDSLACVASTHSLAVAQGSLSQQLLGISFREQLAASAGGRQHQQVPSPHRCSRQPRTAAAALAAADLLSVRLLTGTWAAGAVVAAAAGCECGQ